MYHIIKRLIDLLAGIILLIILFPLLVPIMIALRLTAEGYVFYKQDRIGYKNETFEIYKFATMLKDSPNMKGGSITIRNDPRVTRIGRILRMTKINELPQVINLLNGTMSLVGPRPHMRVDFECYPEHVQQRIFNVKPGITGVGSIIFRDQELLFTKADKDPHEYYRETLAPYKGELELWYQDNVSTWLDIKILFLTAIAVFLPNSDYPNRAFKGIANPPF